MESNSDAMNMLYAAGMILFIAVIAEVYPKLGWALFALAIMAMIAVYRDPKFMNQPKSTFKSWVDIVPRTGG